MAEARKRRHADQVARQVVDPSTADNDAELPARQKNQAAVELGRLGGLKGGPARAAKLTSEERSEIARRAALKRWEGR
jgi:hypothetical protein